MRTEQQISLTLNASSLYDLKDQVMALAKGLGVVVTDIVGNGFDPATGELPETTSDPDPPSTEPTGTRRRRSREAAASQAAKPNGNAADLPAAELRPKTLDILKECYAHSAGGAERVIALQVKFNVKRFSEVPDAKLSELYGLANKLRDELASGKGADDTDAGPF